MLFKGRNKNKKNTSDPSATSASFIPHFFKDLFKNCNNQILSLPTLRLLLVFPPIIIISSRRLHAKIIFLTIFFYEWRVKWLRQWLEKKWSNLWVRRRITRKTKLAKRLFAQFHFECESVVIEYKWEIELSGIAKKIISVQLNCSNQQRVFLYSQDYYTFSYQQKTNHQRTSFVFVRLIVRNI